MSITTLAVIALLMFVAVSVLLIVPALIAVLFCAFASVLIVSMQMFTTKPH